MPVTSEQILRLTLRERIRLVAYISTIVHDRHLAEDLFQDLSVEALGKADTINDEEHLQKWLRTGARFRAIDALRKKSRSPIAFSPDLISKLDEAWEQAEDAVPSETLETLRNCLGEMTPRARRLVDLHYREGLSGKELAERMRQTTNAMYVALSRVHKALRDCMNYRMSLPDMRKKGGRS
jgi:RNA polymerase sigma-70 factor (ECF subfamily)